jgi:hypothetical protein
MGRKAGWFAGQLLLESLGGIALLAWLLFAHRPPWIKFLSVIGTGLFLTVLYRLLTALERRSARKTLAERICDVPYVRPPRWNGAPMENQVLRGPAIKALMAEHKRIARDVEATILTLGYRRKDVQRAIAIGRYEQGMHRYEQLFEFALKKLSSRQLPGQTPEVPPPEIEPPKPRRRAHGAGA